MLTAIVVNIEILQTHHSNLVQRTEVASRLVSSIFCNNFHTISGLTEQAEKIKETVDTEKSPLPEPSEGARLLQPPCAIAQSEQNWPLLTVSRGFFDR